MIISILGFDTEIYFNNNKPAILFIEEAKLYSNITTKIMLKDFSNEISFVDDNITIKESNIFTITDIFNFDINDKKYINLIYKEIESVLKDEMNSYSKIQELFNTISSYILESILDIELNLVYNNEVDIKDFLKIIKLRVDEFGFLNLTDRIHTIIDLFSQIGTDNTYVFIGILSFFDSDEVEEIMKYISYRKINIVFIERYGYDLCNYSNIYHIDNDFID